MQCHEDFPPGKDGADTAPPDLDELLEQTGSIAETGHWPAEPSSGRHGACRFPDHVRLMAAPTAHANGHDTLLPMSAKPMIS